MIFQEALIQRIIIISIFQTWPIFYQLFLAYKLLNRVKNPLSYMLGSYFIFNAIAFIFPFPSIIFINTPLAYCFMFLTWFFIIFSQGFLVIFSWELKSLSKPLRFKKIIPWIGLNLIFTSYVIWAGVLFQGIKYDASTFWIPTFSWEFAITSWIVLSLYLVLPQSIFAFKLLKSFQGEIIKKRILKYLISVILEYFLTFMLILYNTWTDNQIFRLIYLFIISFPLGILAAYLIYKSLIKELDKKVN